MLIRTFLITAIAMLGASCSYHKADILYPTKTATSCDTVAVITYSTDVVNILKANCYVCHGGTAAAGNNIVLDTYSGVKIMAGNGRLVQAISHTGPSNTHMPQFGFKMPECNIAKIRTWVRNGAPNN